MSWTGTIDKFGLPLQNPIPFQQTSDVTFINSNPGIIFAGPETNAQQVESREVAGFYYRVVNAHWNGTNWVCVNTANPAYGFRLNSNGTFEFIYTAATGGNITWSVTASLVESSGAFVLPTVGPTASQQHTLPAVTSDTIALLVAAQTLSNKTLPSASLTGDATLGSGSLAQNATTGFPRLTVIAGAPSGTPSTIAGFAAIAVDNVNHLLKFYDGAWRSAGASDPLTLVNWLAIGTNPAASGLLRLGFAQTGIRFRNNNNTGDVSVLDASGGSGSTVDVLLGNDSSFARMIGLGVAGPLATSVSQGFPGMVYMNGTPTGAPAASGPGYAPFVWDDTNKQFDIFSPGATAWQKFGIPATTFKKGSANGTDYSTTSSTYSAVDNANLSVTIQVLSGQKLIVFCVFTPGSSGGSHVEAFRLQDISAVATLQEAAGLATAAIGTPSAPNMLMGVVNGDGSNHTVQLQFAQTSTGTTLIRNQSNNYATMTWFLTSST